MISPASFACRRVILPFPVIIASPPACFAAPPPCRHRLSVSLLTSSALPPPRLGSSCRVIVLSSLSPPFDKRGGALFACLPRPHGLSSVSSRLVLLRCLSCSPCPHCVVSRPRRASLACPVARGSSPSRLVRSPLCPFSFSPVVVSPLSFSPFFDKRWRGGCRLVCSSWLVGAGRLVCLFAVFSSFVSVSAGASRGVGAWRGCRVGGVGGCSRPCCVWFVVSLFVYINGLLARV